MASYNKVLLMGNVTRDPELRYTPQGVPVTDLGVAVNREYSVGDSGERRKETTFVDVTFWRRRAEVICQYFHKGDPIFVEGRLSMDTWETQDGQKRSRLKVVADSFEFIRSRASGGGGDFRGGGYGEAPSGGGDASASPDYQYPGVGGRPSVSTSDSPPGPEGVETIDDGDIPF